MPKKGRKFLIYGAFKSKKAAKRKERKVKGFILVKRIKTLGRRFVVLKER
jgi:hypothetical protein